MDKFIVKVNNEEISLSFRNPTQEELLGLDLEYRKIFSHCIREGIMSEAEAKKLAEKNNVWNKEDEKKITELAIQMNILESIINDDKSKEEKIKEAIEKISDIRGEMLNKIGQKVSITSLSAEGLALEQKMHKFIIYCCITDDGERYFDDQKQYESFALQHRETLSEIIKQAYFYEFGDPSKIAEEWPEIKYLKRKAKETENVINETIEPVLETTKRKKKIIEVSK